MRKVYIFLIFLAITNFYVFDICAAEIPLNMELKCNGETLNKNEDDIYYLRDSVDVLFSHISYEEDNDLQQEIKKYKEETGEEVNYYVEEYSAVSEYVNEKFENYKKIEGDLYKVESDFNGGTSGYVRKAFIFKKIVSYKIYKETNGEKELLSVIDRDYVSNPYQFIFDNIVPVIVNKSDNSEYKDIKPGTKIPLHISDNIGLSRIVLYKNDKVEDDVLITSDKRIIEYDYDISLAYGSSDLNKMKLVVTDLALNTNEYSFEYNIDGKAPDISTSIQDGKIYGDKASVKILSSDDSGKVFIFYKCIYTDESGEENTIDNYTDEFEGSGCVEREYTKNGIYDIVAFSYDENGNYSEVIRKSIAIDSKTPVTKLENIENNHVYNSDVELYACVNDMFYDGLSVDIEGFISDGVNEIPLQLSPYETGARNNKNVYIFSGDGKYTIKLNAKDATGHISEAGICFSIDKTAPNIEFSIGEEKKVLKDRPLIKVSTFDKMSEYKATINLYHKSDENGFREVSTEQIVSVGKNAEVTVEVPYEGEYMLKAVLVDEALNSTEKTLNFIVDETPPVIGYLSDFNEKYLKSFSLPESFGSYISDMTNVGYKAYLNSKPINSCEIKKDGKYIVQIIAADEALNKSEQAAIFIVDSTAPKVLVQGIDDSGKVKKDGMIRLTLLDENDYFKGLKVNGVDTSFDNDKEINVKACNYGNYDISVVAADYAGNEITEVVKMECAMAGNPFTIKIDKSDIETLTKNDDQIRENFFENKVVRIVVIFSGIIALSLVIFAVFSFVDRDTNKG